MPIRAPDSRKQVSDRMLTDVQTSAPESRPFLKVSWLRSLIQSIANRIFDFYLQQEVQLLQTFPDTATGEFLDRWGSYINIIRTGLSKSIGLMSIQGSAVIAIPLGTLFQADGNQYETLAAENTAATIISTLEVTFSSGIVNVVTDGNHNLSSSLEVIISGASESAYDGTFPIIVTAEDVFTYSPDSTPVSTDGGTPTVDAGFLAVLTIQSVEFGEDNNLGNGAAMTITTPLPSLEDIGFTQFGGVAGGSDGEDEEVYREGVLDGYRNPNTCFNATEIIKTAKTIAGTTRVFVLSPDTTQVSVSVTELIQLEDNIIKATVGAPLLLTNSHFIKIIGANEVDYDTPNPVMGLVKSSTEFVYASAVAPVSSPATGAIRMEYSPIDAGEVKVFFLRDDDLTPIPNPAQVAQMKDLLVDTLKPADMAIDRLIVEAPVEKFINFDFEIILPNTKSMQNSIEDNLSAFFRDETAVGRSIDENIYNGIIFNTIDNQTGERLQNFVLNAPAGTINAGENEIPFLGTVTFNS